MAECHLSAVIVLGQSLASVTDLATPLTFGTIVIPHAKDLRMNDRGLSGRDASGSWRSSSRSLVACRPRNIEKEVDAGKMGGQ